ncbi:MAG: ribonuclease P protein component [Bacteroidales bacterium]
MKQERLRNNRETETLFLRGRSMVFPGFRFIWTTQPREGTAFPPVRVAILVPKRIFRKAAQRNLIKRRIREAYRRNKIPVVSSIGRRKHSVHLIILYTRRELLPYSRIEKDLVASMKHWLTVYEKNL